MARRGKGVAAVGLLSVLLLVSLVFSVSAKQQQQKQDNSSSTSVSVTVKTKEGVLEGFQQGETLYFLGIPYAVPPTGTLRWAPPKPFPAWTGTLNATSFSPACYQGQGTAFVAGGRPMSEDCLYVNVFAPQGATAYANLPVMVWIYGGGFDSGDAASYNATSLVGHDVVVVTFNYRLGPLGFAAHPALQATSHDGSTGFYGILDQVLALKWVQRNIEYFGGNPNNVTLFGESAGAISTCVHLVLPASHGLFNITLFESAFCDIWDLSTGMAEGERLAAGLGCNASLSNEAMVSCMRSASPQTLIKTLWKPWFPVVDGVYLTAQPSQYLANGTFNPITAALVGTNANEFAFFGCQQYRNITAEQYVFIIGGFFGPETAKLVLAQYPVNVYSSPVEALNAVFSDLVFRCPSKYLADKVSSTGVSTYMYSFTHVPAFAKDPCFGPAHAFEMAFVYPEMLPLYLHDFHGQPFTPAEKELSVFMRSAWTNMAATGVPTPSWPKYNAESSPYLQLNIPLANSQNFLDKQCAFWAKHPCKSNLKTCQH